MNWRRWAGSMVLVAGTALACSCSGDNPGTNFTITDDLDDAVYVYDFDEGQMRVRFFSDANAVVGVVDSYNGLFSVGIIGVPIGADSFRVTGAALDSNNDGNFLDEPLIPVTGDSSGIFENNGHRLTIDVHVLVNGAPITFADVGNLDHVEDVPPL
jgi:hypothetical protein